MVQHDERYEVRNADIERALRTIGVLIDGEAREEIFAKEYKVTQPWEPLESGD